MGILLQFPNQAPRMPGEGRHAHRRRSSFAPVSLHTYRRALIRRMGLHEAGRPALVLDNVALALLRARCA
ncbi:MAG: hypothetical protein HC822_26460 [Oscillochloris sp.]|nr:hypothetical protein [Oscillochloris sp.]